MGWVAAGGATFVAACIIYKLCVDGNNSDNDDLVVPPAKQREGKAQEQRAEIKVQEADKTDANGIVTEQPPVISVTPSSEVLRQARIPHAGNSTSLLLSREQYAQSSIMAPPARPSSPPRLKPPTFGSGPAPPRPANGMPVRPPPSAASSLRVPVTKVLQNTSMAPSSLMAPPNKPSRQVILKPGHSPLDWAMLTSKPNHQLRGINVPTNLIKVTPSQLRYHSGRKGKDAWTVYQGKVYNITPYLPFHPGGEGELMKSAAREAGKLFMEVHPWVNWDGILGECLVGILVGEGEDKITATNASGGLDEMD